MVVTDRLNRFSSQFDDKDDFGHHEEEGGIDCVCHEYDDDSDYYGDDDDGDDVNDDDGNDDDDTDDGTDDGNGNSC